jgi:hypothetical protein
MTEMQATTPEGMEEQGSLLARVAEPLDDGSLIRTDGAVGDIAADGDQADEPGLRIG